MVAADGLAHTWIYTIRVYATIVSVGVNSPIVICIRRLWWSGCIHHVVGIHHWSLGQAVEEASCLHGELENEGQDKPLLKRDSKAHLAHRSIVVQGNWLKNAGQHHCNFRCVISWVSQGTPWKCFPLHWPYMRGIFQSSVDFPHKGPVI